MLPKKPWRNSEKQRSPPQLRSRWLLVKANKFPNFGRLPFRQGLMTQTSETAKLLVFSYHQTFNFRYLWLQKHLWGRFLAFSSPFWGTKMGYRIIFPRKTFLEYQFCFNGLKSLNNGVAYKSLWQFCLEWLSIKYCLYSSVLVKNVLTLTNRNFFLDWALYPTSFCRVSYFVRPFKKVLLMDVCL